MAQRPLGRGKSPSTATTTYFASIQHDIDGNYDDMGLLRGKVYYPFIKSNTSNYCSLPFDAMSTTLKQCHVTLRPPIHIPIPFNMTMTRRQCLISQQDHIQPPLNSYDTSDALTILYLDV